MMRVRADALEKLVNEAGEIAIARSRVETEMHALKSALVELTENVARLRRELREIEIAARSIPIAAGTPPNTVLAREDPDNFELYGR